MHRFSWTGPLRFVRNLILAFVGFLVIGNLVILGLHGVASARVSVEPVDGINGVGKIRRVTRSFKAALSMGHVL